MFVRSLTKHLSDDVPAKWKSGGCFSLDRPSFGGTRGRKNVGQETASVDSSTILLAHTLI